MNNIIIDSIEYSHIDNIECSHISEYELITILPITTSSVSVARNLARNFFALKNEISDTSLYELEVIVAELSTNVIRHSHSSINKYIIKLTFDNSIACVIVKDFGIGFDIPISLNIPDINDLESMERTDLDGSYRIGGMGLGLVKSLATSIEFEFTNGVTVNVKKEV